MLQPMANAKRAAAALLALCLALLGAGALADGKTLVPTPPDVPVYWQLARVEQSPEVHAAGGYAVWGELTGMQPDLSDPLLTASVLEAEDAVQGVKLIFEKNDQVVMEHEYIWTPLPVFIVPDGVYPIEVSGLKTAGGQTPNSLLGIYRQGEQLARISAGEYSGHAHQASFEVTTEHGIYSDGTFVVSFVLRDVNDMYRNRITYVYEMQDGLKPEPTPVPGYVPVDMSEVTVPHYYIAVPDHEALYTIVTAPDEYRAYGSMSGSVPAFFPATADGRVAMNEAPVDPEEDFNSFVRGFVPAEAVGGVPAYYRRADDGLYTFTTRDGECIERAFGRIDGGDPMFYAVAGGIVPQGAEPVNPEDDFEQYIKGFGPAAPADVPAHYAVRENGVYAFTGRDGVERFRVYGRLDGADAQYYVADARGSLTEDIEPVTPEADFEQYIRGFDAAPLDASVVPPHYREVDGGLYAIEDRQGNTVYRVYGVKDGRPAAFYPSTPQGQPEREDVEPVDPETDYEAFVKGFESTAPAEVPSFYEATEVPGVWGFVDKDDSLQYRAHGSLNRTEPAFYPANALGEVQADALPVNPASDLALLPPPPFVSSTPETLPPHYRIIDAERGVYGYQDETGETRHYVYGARGSGTPGFFPSGVDGQIAYDAAPVDTDQEYARVFGTFTAAVPQTVPPRYEVVAGTEGLYRYEDSLRNTVRRIYGAFEGDAENRFYPADEQGRVTSLQPADPAADLKTMPLILENTIATQPPASEALATPLIRTQQSGTTRWNDPNGPQPTEYIANILPRQTQPGTPGAVARMITAAPALDAEPLPTVYDKAVADRSAAPQTAPSAVAAMLQAATLAPPQDADVIAAVQSPAGQSTRLPAVTGALAPTAEGKDAAVNAAVKSPAGQGTQLPAVTGALAPATGAPAAASTEAGPAQGGINGTDAETTPTAEASADAATEAPATEEAPTDAPATDDAPTDAPVTDAPATETPATEAPAASPTAQAASAPAPSGTVRWIVLGVIAVIVIGGVVYYFVRRGRDES